ncbi:hypothetical protein SDRG_05989 [Saprolegnia diclina VS20]|uniref:t-SNARE coiled-coil homology domain-containing protein n=1 Tax=Saprolegnia diclina (strain VS20) TaxID=1156394 RepID=T0QRJ1_SAPDV|nr:hypothetical protein SDRG_05989 [Saprolegnia diclina VS20]EQC36540.1 hypothetical protein SDRG_05989 [Saprolegnia diclina VS20]|eukprot:XP_008609961.1 hypothetical protein SDRG_05989 [Saprolegnia diclina VS20]
MSTSTSGLLGAKKNMSNYGTYHGDPNVQRLMETSDKLERTKQTIAQADLTARHVLVELESQRGQFQDMKDMVHETNSATTQVNHYLVQIRDRALRRKICLWFIIVLLTIADVFFFYYFFLKQ